MVKRTAWQFVFEAITKALRSSGALLGLTNGSTNNLEWEMIQLRLILSRLKKQGPDCCQQIKKERLNGSNKF